VRSQPRKRKQQRSGGKEGINFAISLITMTVVFVFIGYLLGQYAVKLLRAQHSAQVRVVQTTTPAAQTGQPAKAVQSPPAASSPASPQSTPVAPSPAAQAPAQPQSVPEQASGQGALYRVQVGAFSSRANAERVVNQLKELGYEAIISSGPPYRVQTGAFASRDNAVRLGEELKAKGFEVAVVN